MEKKTESREWPPTWVDWLSDEELEQEGINEWNNLKDIHEFQLRALEDFKQLVVGAFNAPTRRKL